jgi:pimeloyl-ACP methyl ester carboxylesterase
MYAECVSSCLWRRFSFPRLQVENGVVFTQDRCLRCSSLLRMNEEQVKECLERIACPILVVLGDQGFLYTDYEPLFKQLYPERKRLVAKHLAGEIVVPGGHHVHLDNPEPVAREIAALFARSAADDQTANA